MPKITVGGGASDKGDLAYTYDVDRAAARLRAAAPATAGLTAHQEPTPLAEPTASVPGWATGQLTDEGGEQPSPGNSSSTSSTKTSSSSEKTETASRSRARTAGNRSKQGKATSSTARPGTTNTRATTSESDD